MGRMSNMRKRRAGGVRKGEAGNEARKRSWRRTRQGGRRGGYGGRSGGKGGRGGDRAMRLWSAITVFPYSTLMIQLAPGRNQKCGFPQRCCR
eukprot:7692873-Pyramimonas_sp.AAC.1